MKDEGREGAGLIIFLFRRSVDGRLLKVTCIFLLRGDGSL